MTTLYIYLLVVFGVYAMDNLIAAFKPLRNTRAAYILDTMVFIAGFVWLLIAG